MEKKYMLAAIAIIFFMLLGLGAVVSERCIDIGGCKACWKTTAVVVKSELCPNSSACLARPADQQNNAIVDAVICGCGKAKASNYGDAELNKKIEDVINQFTRYNISASEACEQAGTFLVKRSYEFSI